MMKNASIKDRILIPLTLGLLALLVVFLVSLIWMERNNLQQRVTRQFKSAEHFFASQQENDAHLLSGILETVMNDRAIQRALKAGDRKALLSLTAPLFKKISSQHPVTHLYFSDNQRINLLRVHQPDRYGDRIDRQTTLRAEKSGEIAFGLELGPLGTLTLRVVAPMIIKGQRIGFVELGEEIDHISAKMKQTAGVDMIVYLHKNLLNRPGWEAGMKMMGRAADWDRFPNVVLVEKTLPVFPEALTPFLSEGSHRLGATELEIVSQDRRYRCRFLEITDVTGREVGNLVVMIDVTDQTSHLYTTMGLTIGFSIFLGGGLFFFIRFFLGRVDNQMARSQGKIIALEKDNTRMESEAKFYAVAQSLNDAMISSDPAGRITFWNPEAVVLFGYPKEEVLGRPLTMLMPEQYREAHVKGMERLRSGGEGRIMGKTTELLGLKKDGTEFPLELSLAQWSSGNETFYTGLIRDITQRKQADEALRESQRHQKAILDNIPDIAWLKDHESKFIAVNEPFGRSCGFKPEDLVGKTDLDIWPKELAEKYRADDQEVMESGRRKQVEEPIIDPEGKTFWVETIKTPIFDEHGKVIGTAGIARDITEHKQAEEAEKRSFEQLRKALGATVGAIVTVVEMRDPYTAGHQKRVADLARAMAGEMGLSQDQIDGIRTAGLIHDIGKIAVPAEILSKPTKLTELEFNLIKTHAQSGHDLLKDIAFPWPIARIVHEHHERMDGSGYPKGLTGHQILLESRILMIADVVEAIESHRPYRPALGIEVALKEIEKNAGVLYDREAVEVCLKLFREKGFRFE
jgi:PAS domain S-box-containing protein/putative nucleotidyltransferase with HDIG domain